MSTYGDIMGSLAKKCPHGKSLDVDCAVCKKMDSIQRRKDAQLAALTAENATLQMELEAANIAAGEWEETAAELTAERNELRAALAQAVKDLTQIVKSWRDYASEDYCTITNPEMGNGLKRAANHLGRYVSEARRALEKNL